MRTLPGLANDGLGDQLLGSLGVAEDLFDWMGAFIHGEPISSVWTKGEQ